MHVGEYKPLAFWIINERGSWEDTFGIMDVGLERITRATQTRTVELTTFSLTYGVDG